MPALLLVALGGRNRLCISASQVGPEAFIALRCANRGVAKLGSWVIPLLVGSGVEFDSVGSPACTCIEFSADAAWFRRILRKRAGQAAYWRRLTARHLSSNDGLRVLQTVATLFAA